MPRFRILSGKFQSNPEKMHQIVQFLDAVIGNAADFCEHLLTQTGMVHGQHPLSTVTLAYQVFGREA